MAKMRSRWWSWYQFSEGGFREGTLLVNITVRKWHPGFWLFVATRILQRLRGQEFVHSDDV